MNIKYSIVLYFIAAVFIFSGCASFDSEPQMTSLQIQAIQSREFETSKAIAFTSTMSALQDSGYTISMAGLDTGFITGESPTQQGFFSGISNIKVTAFIQPLPNGNTKIRLNFVTRSQIPQQNSGVITTDTAIYDPKTYQDAFNKIQEQIFINTPFQGATKTSDTMLAPDMPSGVPAQ